MMHDKILINYGINYIFQWKNVNNLFKLLHVSYYHYYLILWLLLNTNVSISSHITFIHIHTAEYSDTALDLHENEIARLRQLTQDRKPILEKVESHMKLLEEIKDFEVIIIIRIIIRITEESNDFLCHSYSQGK